MTPRNDGGPAFPVEIQWNEADNRIIGLQTGPCAGFHTGMTLRDWFAGQALRGLMGRAWGDEDGHTPPNIIETWAMSAYAIADAMLRARESDND